MKTFNQYLTEIAWQQSTSKAEELESYITKKAGK